MIASLTLFGVIAIMVVMRIAVLVILVHNKDGSHARKVKERPIPRVNSAKVMHTLSIQKAFDSFGIDNSGFLYCLSTVRELKVRRLF